MPATRRKTDEFITHYDRLSAIYGDPIKVLFEIAFNHDIQPSDRRAAASDLLSYRFPKQKAIDLNLGAGADGLAFVMIAPDSAKSAALTAQQEFGLAQPVIDVEAELVD